MKDDGQQMQQLADACLVVDALDESVREELVRNICSKELTAYQQIFQGTGRERSFPSLRFALKLVPEGHFPWSLEAL